MNGPSGGDPKRAVYERLSHVPKAIASGSRLELLDLLSQGEKTVETLARQAGLSVANASRHLKVLREAGLARVRRDGRHAHYRVSGSDVVRLVRSVHALAEARLADLDGLLRALHPEDPEPLTLAALRQRMERGEVVLLDVRPEDEYAAGHLPGARSIPVTELEARIDELPSEGEVVAYCRGPYCRLSDDAVALLRRYGRTARRLRDGPADWRETRTGLRGASG